MKLTAQEVQKICRELNLYVTPSLNEQLYLNFRGISKLDGLDAYIGVKSIFLEGNALTDLQGIPPHPDLQCLFVQNNALRSLSGLPPGLITLNLAANQLSTLAGLSTCCTTLTSLIASDNSFEDAPCLSELFMCKALESLDLQNNQLADCVALLQHLAALPDLKCLYLKGNPLVTATSNYRKRVIAGLPGLTYLDERPVTEEEKRCAAAWLQGGIEAEREERKKCMEERRDQARKDYEAFQRLKAEVQTRRLGRLQLLPSSESETSVLQHPCSRQSSLSLDRSSDMEESVYNLAMD